MGTRRRNLTRAIRANAEIRAARAAIGEHQPSGQGYPGPGSVNAYRCGTCDAVTVTVHRAAGVTPMFLACRITPGCEGRAVSGMYSTPKAQLPPPTHEWYQPADRQIAPGVRTHVAKGGLLLRPVTA